MSGLWGSDPWQGNPEDQNPGTGKFLRDYQPVRHLSAPTSLTTIAGKSSTSLLEPNSSQRPAGPETNSPSSRPPPALSHLVLTCLKSFSSPSPSPTHFPSHCHYANNWTSMLFSNFSQLDSNHTSCHLFCIFHGSRALAHLIPKTPHGTITTPSSQGRALTLRGLHVLPKVML